MKDVQSLTELELAMEIEQLQSSNENPERLKRLKNEALGRAYANQS